MVGSYTEDLVNHRTVKIEEWALAWKWVLAWDCMLVRGLCFTIQTIRWLLWGTMLHQQLQ